MEKKKRRFNWTLWILIGSGIIIGFVIGLLCQQMIFIASLVKVAEGLEGTTFNIEVDFNETQLVEGFTKYFNETLNLNETIKNDK